ncbi:hypothetical protein [Oculatella sp. LEGE 06141]
MRDFQAAGPIPLLLVDDDRAIAQPGLEHTAAQTLLSVCIQ